MHPGRHLAVLGGIFAILYALVYFTGSGGWQDRFEPKLGLDLVGGTRVTLQAKTEDGKPPPASSLEQAKQIIENRVNGLGVTEAEVITDGNANITVSLAGKSDDRLKEIGNPAQLRFRTVLSTTGDTAASSDVDPSASASAPASASASGSASAAPSASASASAKASSTPSASASTSASANASPSGSTSATPVPPTIKELQASVEKKLGPGFVQQVQQNLQQPADFTQQPEMAQVLAPFKELTPEEVAVLPTPVQFNVPYVTCKKLNNRPAGSIIDPNQQAVACDKGQKYLLDVAKVLGTDVKGAEASIDPQSSQWQVNLQFKGAGQDKWTNLTKEAYGDGTNKKQVAVVLDNEVVSAPTIQSVIPGDAQITGSFTRGDATLLASQLRYGALPLTFVQQEAQNVSATLGTEHLKAGLLAAGIGMLLVIVYAFFYYRLLGSVIFLSLVLSGLLVFGMLIVLGRNIGFTLTLAGIAGFIVSLGVAADSFVIYFERLKDEIRDGRSPRSAVPRAWVRARRTIITANTISILAAVVLYIFSVGSVKGFAFALGLATFLDLVVVFLFRHPIMTMFARTKAFLSPRVSGLGRVLEQRDGTDTVVKTRGSRVKEA
jgi:preprotein translocase subunit SecD